MVIGHYIEDTNKNRYYSGDNVKVIMFNKDEFIDTIMSIGSDLTPKLIRFKHRCVNLTLIKDICKVDTI